MAIIIFFIIHWYTSLFFQSFFHHRYAAHRHFTMTIFWERFFFVCSFLTMGSSYISPYAYGIMHRLHHQHTDKEDDPHSPVNHPKFLSMMLNTRNNYFKIFSGKTLVDDKIKKDLPRWDAFDKIAHNWLTRFTWISLYILFYISFATAAWQYLFLPLTIIMGTLQGAAVNWWAHKYGYVNYKMDNDSKNILPVDILFWGEAYHNNHHHNPGKAKNSHKWFEFDATYLVVRILNRLGVVHL